MIRIWTQELMEQAAATGAAAGGVNCQPNARSAISRALARRPTISLPPEVADGGREQLLVHRVGDAGTDELEIDHRVADEGKDHVAVLAAERLVADRGDGSRRVDDLGPLEEARASGRCHAEDELPGVV